MPFKLFFYVKQKLWSLRRPTRAESPSPPTQKDQAQGVIVRRERETLSSPAIEACLLPPCRFRGKTGEPPRRKRRRRLRSWLAARTTFRLCEHEGRRATHIYLCAETITQSSLPCVCSKRAYTCHLHPVFSRARGWCSAASLFETSLGFWDNPAYLTEPWCKRSIVFNPKIFVSEETRMSSYGDGYMATTERLLQKHAYSEMHKSHAVPG